MEDILRRLVIALLALGVSIGTSALVMIYGWGLEPQSWWWIIGFYLLGSLGAVGFSKLAEK